jgi:hypothetical protein
MEADFLFHFGPFHLYMDETSEGMLYRMRGEGRPVWNTLARREIGEAIEVAEKEWLLRKAREAKRISKLK